MYLLYFYNYRKYEQSQHAMLRTCNIKKFQQHRIYINFDVKWYKEDYEEFKIFFSKSRIRIAIIFRSYFKNKI